MGSKQESPNYCPRAKDGPRGRFFSNKNDTFLTNFVCLVECDIPKQSHYVTCPILELLCNSLCGPLTKSLEISGPRHCVAGYLHY